MVRRMVMAVAVVASVWTVSATAQKPGQVAKDEIAELRADLASLKASLVRARWARSYQRAMRQVWPAHPAAAFWQQLRQGVWADVQAQGTDVTNVITLTPAVRQAGRYAFVAPQPIPAGLTSVTFQANLSLADKLAVGKSFSSGLYVSNDGGVTRRLIAGATWDSYGPGGITSGGITNPDPEVGTGDIRQYVGWQLSADLTLDQSFTAGLTVFVR